MAGCKLPTQYGPLKLDWQQANAPSNVAKQLDKEALKVVALSAWAPSSLSLHHVPG